MIITLDSAFKPQASGSVRAIDKCQRNRIVADACQHYDWQGSSQLSLSAYFNGQACFEINGRRLAVGDGSYLIVNREQPFVLNLAAKTNVEYFCVFFEAGLAEEAQCSLTASTERLLDEPEMAVATPVEFLERAYRYDELVAPALLRLRAQLPERKDDAGWLQEQLYELLGRMIELRGQTRREMERLSALRAATREELYRRLCRAREHLAASFTEPLTLAEMARIACLSPTHFLRTFKQAFGQTPHQYLTALRSQQAQRLLRQTDLPVVAICEAVGFASLGSFSRLFHRRLGVAPDAFRRAKR
jgi:AraC-like DNA-binding protein